MTYITEKLWNLSTWGVTLIGIGVNWESIKSGVLFVLGVVLLILQIRLHLIKLKNEKRK